jgi:hypothetical protein
MAPRSASNGLIDGAQQVNELNSRSLDIGEGGRVDQGVDHENKLVLAICLVEVNR